MLGPILILPPLPNPQELAIQREAEAKAAKKFAAATQEVQAKMNQVRETLGLDGGQESGSRG